MRPRRWLFHFLGSSRPRRWLFGFPLLVFAARPLAFFLSFEGSLRPRRWLFVIFNDAAWRLGHFPHAFRKLS